MVRKSQPCYVPGKEHITQTEEPCKSPKARRIWEHSKDWALSARSGGRWNEVSLELGPSEPCRPLGGVWIVFKYYVKPLESFMLGDGIRMGRLIFMSHTFKRGETSRPRHQNHRRMSERLSTMPLKPQLHFTKHKLCDKQPNTLACWIFTTTLWASYSYPILQVTRLKLRDLKAPVQMYTACSPCTRLRLNPTAGILNHYT